MFGFFSKSKALCGAELLDEKKEVDVEGEHSLTNIVAFSSKKNQMWDPSEEGLIIFDKDGNEVDRRTKVIYSDRKFGYASYYMLSQITAKMLNGKKGVGSCAEVRKKGKGRYWLTCAHNLKKWGPRNKRVVAYTDFHIYKARQGEGAGRSTLICRGDDKNVSVHPKWNGQPDCGFDIGIIPLAKIITTADSFAPLRVLNNFESDIWRDVVWANVNPHRIKKGMSVELAGFPGEKKGWPYTHRGKIVDVTKTKLGGHLLWYDADGTPGNSGSCIMITDKHFVKSVQSSDKIQKVIVGVHTAHCDVDNLNYGTLITPSIGEWIDKC